MSGKPYIFVILLEVSIDPGSQYSSTECFL